MLMETERTEIIKYAKLMAARGLTRGTGGNISRIARESGYVAITPTGVEYDALEPEDIPVVDLRHNVVEGGLLPSSELNMHLACYEARPDVRAVVHTHSTYATLMACLGKPIEPIHYLIGFAGGEVAVTPYIIFGTETLAQEAVRIMGASRNAVLLGNHGLLAVGKNLPAAFNVAEETEFVAELNYKAMCVGGCKTISEELFRETMVKFETYGQQLGGR